MTIISEESLDFNFNSIFFFAKRKKEKFETKVQFNKAIMRRRKNEIKKNKVKEFPFHE